MRIQARWKHTKISGQTQSKSLTIPAPWGEGESNIKGPFIFYEVVGRWWNLEVEIGKKDKGGPAQKKMKVKGNEGATWTNNVERGVEISRNV